jgi:hypothetical protein
MGWLKLLAAFLALLVPGQDNRPAAATFAAKGGSTWLAFASGPQVTIYRFDHLHLHVDGSVRLPAGFPIRRGEALVAASAIPGDAPNFAVRQWGADTLWFAIAARLHGRWEMVPFDDMDARRHRYTFAFGASNGLIHGIVDSCGCASGPTTYQWYRFARGVFVATSPPGPHAECSATALGEAHHWPRLPEDRLLRTVDRPITISRFACAAGWALATDGRRIGVYEQRGRGWLRVGVGSPHLVGLRVEFAMARSLLDRLGRRIGVAFAR